ncbi:MAG: hypothetical protein NTX25_20565 [Proteobacteria bacterium]|nr:hypothetical protein [Pseudomonadota bacterium]
MAILLEVIGWLSTLILVASYLMRDRRHLHSITLVACVFKAIYSYNYQVWPLFTNWVILFFVQIWQIYRFGKTAGFNQTMPTVVPFDKSEFETSIHTLQPENSST